MYDKTKLSLNPARYFDVKECYKRKSSEDFTESLDELEETFSHRELARWQNCLMTKEMTTNELTTGRTERTTKKGRLNSFNRELIC